MTGGVKPDLVMKLPQLQNLIKRDPSAYKEEFKQQFRSYQAEFKLFTLKPSRDAPRFEELVNFMSHVAPCYPQECGDLPDQLMQLLDESATVMTPRVRKTIVQALILMRNRGLVDVPALLRLIFKLFRCQDKALREMLYEYVVTDIRNVNQKAKNDKLNRELQAFMYVMLKDEHSIAAKRSLEAMVELYRRRVWTDARTVNVIASACLSQAVRLMVIATNFFLGIEQKMADDEDEEVAKAEKIDVDFHEHSKKTKARVRDTRKQLKKRKAMAKKAQQEKEGEKTAPQPLFPAIQMLHDPQGLADKLFKRLRTCTERFEVKLLLMNFLSRLIGHHKLLVLNFYSFVQRYLNSHQKDVTVILAYLVQACHDLVPPGELLPVVKNVANAFVADRCSSEVIAVGINALREVMVRTPSLLYEDGMDGFVQDISAYCRTKDKSVMMAARTFLNTVRELYPALLQARHRGKNHIKGAQPSQYGEMKVAEGVEGAELLQALEEGRLTLSDDEQEGEEEDDDEEGWVDMEEGDDDEEEGEEMEVGSGDEGEEEEEEEESDDGEEEEEEEELGSDQEGWVNMSDDEEEGDEEEEEEEDDDDEEEEEEEGEEGEEERPSPTVGSKRSRIEAMRERRVLRKAMKDPLYEPPSTAKDVIEETVKVKDQKSRIDAQRILTEEDFEKIKKLKAKVEAMKRDPKKVKRGKKDEEISDGEIEIEDDDAPKGWLSSSVVRPEDLEGFVKKKRASKEERLMRIVSGKKDFEHTGHAGGLTNLEKQRRKSYLMVRKGKRSVFSKLRDTQQEQKARKVKGVKSKFKREARKRRRV